MPMHWTYPVIMASAMVLGAWLSRRSQRPLGLDASQRAGLALGAFCGAMIGAKLPFVLLTGWGDLLAGRAWFDGGKTIVFGLVGGYAGVELAKSLLDIRVKTGDSFAVPVAASVAVGRLACFASGCCFGATTSLPWGVDFGDGCRRHPTQLYEAAFHGAAALALVAIARRGWLKGQRIKLYIIAYLFYRFLTEYIRPESRLALGWTAYQWACLGLIPVFLALWVRDARRLNPPAIAAEPA